jgi:TnpA family transposase
MVARTAGQFLAEYHERQSKKVKQLLDLLVDQYLIAALTPEYMHGYAEGMRLRRPSRFAQLKEPRRTIELVSFMQFTLFEHTDLLVKLIDRQVSRIWSRASKEAKSVIDSTAPADAFVGELREVLSCDTLGANGKIARITTLLATLDATTGRRKVAARQRQILVGQISQIRPLVEILLDLDLCADSVDWWPPLLKAWRHVYQCPWLPLTQDTCPPTSRAWKELLADPDLRRSRNAAEAQLLWELRQALRRGSLFIPHSLDYRSRDALFNLEGTTVRAPGSARAAPEFLDQLCAHLEVALENLDEAISFQDLKIDGTKIHQHPLGPQITPIDLAPVRDNLYDSLPKIHLPELLLEVDAQIRFSWILLGREPASDDELLCIYVALLGHAMDLSAPRMQLMTPRLSVTGIDDALHLLEEPASLRRANEAAIEFMQSHPMAVNWGDLGDCAADAMSLDASRHIWLARTDPKRRTFSTATYVHTLARHGIVYDQPLAVTQRQQGAAIEGALRQRNAPIRRVFSDTHGYSAFGMTLGKFEGIDLCPRLRSFKDRRLHIPRGRRIEVPESLKNVCIADVSLETITKGWTQLSNIADAVAAGRISAVLACERYGSASRGEKAYKAGRDLGLLLRTLHQCDTLSIPEFRRETLRLLNHNERTHTLQRQIRRAGTTSRRGRRAEELSAQSGALALVTNLVIAWNTHALQATLNRWHAELGKKIDRGTLRHITPMGFERINFNGVLIFPLDRFRNRLMPSNTPSVRPASAPG